MFPTGIQSAAEIASHQGMTPGELQKVEVAVFEKKYSPIVLSKKTMLALHLAERDLRAVLGQNMNRILHLTLDSFRWDEQKKGGWVLPCQSFEITASVLCGGGQVVEIEALIVLTKYGDGEWQVNYGGKDEESLSFPGCKQLKGLRVYFLVEKPDQYWIWDASTGATRKDMSVETVRQALLE
jgi:hypothetical protein